MTSYKNTFTPEQRRVLEDWGWQMNADLVGDVYVKLVWQKENWWAVINPDGTTYNIITDNISDALGTY